jgi:hypothetical protein
MSWDLEGGVASTIKERHVEPDLIDSEESEV